MRTLLPLVALLALAACDTGPSRQQALASLVGRPESDALRSLGAPNRVIEANGHKFLAYDDQRVGYQPTPFIAPFGFYGYGYGYGYGGAIPVVQGCETTLEVVGGNVASFHLRGNAC